MKKAIGFVAIVCFCMTIINIPVLATNQASGFSDLSIPGNKVAISFQNSSKENIEESADHKYPGAERAELYYEGAQAGKQYVLLVTSSELGASSVITRSNLVYISQRTGNGGARFPIHPNNPVSNQTFYVYMTGNGTTGITSRELVASFKSYNSAIAQHTNALGDVNGDGHINAVDATCALQIFAGFKNGNIDWTPDQIWAADVNQDNHQNAVDATLILQHFAGMLDENWNLK